MLIRTPTRAVEPAVRGSGTVAAAKDVLLAEPLLASLDDQLASGKLCSSSTSGEERVGLVLGLDVVPDDGVVGSDGGVEVNVQRLQEILSNGINRGNIILGAVISFGNFGRRIRGRNTALVENPKVSSQVKGLRNRGNGSVQYLPGSAYHQGSSHSCRTRRSHSSRF